MSDWNAGYVVDLEYTVSFYRELTPAILQTGLLAAGATLHTRINSYCELGCGHGLSMNILAAANPDIDFYATDFNPAQIANAKKLSSDAGLGNVHFFDQSFADFILEPTLPDKFDVIALHGIYSWVNPEIRKQVVDFLDKKLRPGGLVYVSYNTLPGWSAALGLRHLMYLHGKETGGPSLNRVKPALDLMTRMVELKAGYFRSSPALGGLAEMLQTQNKNYLAHEYFNDAWTAFYHNDVVNELRPARLSFIGPSHFLDHVEILNTTKEQRALMAQHADATFREVLKDFMTNQPFRKDLFGRGTLHLSKAEIKERWLAQRFVLSTPSDNVPMKVKTPLGEAGLHEEAYRPILEAFAKGVRPLNEVLGEDAIVKLGGEKMMQALMVLLGANHLQPALEAKGEADRRRTTRAFNLAVAQHVRHANDISFMASPVTGGGHPVTRFDQLFLLMEWQKSKDPVGDIWKLMSLTGEQLLQDGVPLVEEAANRARLVGLQQEFIAKRPILVNLGIA